MNKLTKFIEVLAGVQAIEGLTLEQRMQLEEMKIHFIQLNTLAQPIAGAIPTTVVAPVPNPTAPGAMQLTTGVVPEVTGCVAAQPKSIQQEAAQQQLNAQLAAIKAEEDLTAQLAAQVTAQQAQPVAPVQPVGVQPTGIIAAGVDPLTAELAAQLVQQQPVVVADAESQPVKTLQEAVQEAQPVQPAAPVAPTAPAPAAPMTLGQFVQQGGGAKQLTTAPSDAPEDAPVAPTTLQDQFNAGLAQPEQE